MGSGLCCLTNMSQLIGEKKIVDGSTACVLASEEKAESKLSPQLNKLSYLHSLSDRF